MTYVEYNISHSISRFSEVSPLYRRPSSYTKGVNSFFMIERELRTLTKPRENTSSGGTTPH